MKFVVISVVLLGVFLYALGGLIGLGIASRVRVAALMDAYRAEHDAWQLAAREDVLAGRDPKPEPPEPDLGADRDATFLFEQQRQEWRDDRKRVLNEIADEIERQAEEDKGRAAGRGRSPAGQDAIAPYGTS